MIWLMAGLMVVMLVLCIHEHMRARAWRVYAETVMRHKQEALAREQRGLEVFKIFTRDTEKLFRELRAEGEKARAEREKLFMELWAERDAAVAELQRVTHGKA